MQLGSYSWNSIAGFNLRKTLIIMSVLIIFKFYLEKCVYILNLFINPIIDRITNFIMLCEVGALQLIHIQLLKAPSGSSSVEDLTNLQCGANWADTAAA